MKKAVQLWLERAEYDWQTAKVMMESGRFLYVAFMCQQSIEKMLKGLIQHKSGQMPPYTHNLVMLAQSAGLSFSEHQLDFLALLTRYYLNTRYPDAKQKLAAEINDKKAREILSKTEGVYKCLWDELKI